MNFKAAPLTEHDFRRIALGMKDVVESAHMDHPDFRVAGRIFATLHHDRLYGMVALTPAEQRDFVRDYAAAFKPEAGAWGLQGSTAVRLEAVEEDVLGEALTLAWRGAVAKGPTRPRPRKATKTTRRR